MKVLVLHNRYKYPGGEDQVVGAEKQLLLAKGHEVAKVTASNDSIDGWWPRAKSALSAVYSTAHKRAVRGEILAFKPDIVHVHNFFPLLSPSVYDACRSAGVPVVQTLHNYRLACPNALFFYGNAICEDCLGKTIAWPGVLRGCYRGSRLQTLPVAAMLAVHKVRGTWRIRVDRFVVLTRFQKHQLVAAGLPDDRMTVKPNFVEDPGMKTGLGDFALCVGRLSAEKGLGALLDAWGGLGLGMPLRIVGTGPLESQIARRLQQARTDVMITLEGGKSKEEVLRLMKAARFLVFPSLCYETFGLSIIEAFACGLPVIASRIGGIPEIVEEGRTGWLVELGDADAWARTIKEAWDNSEECARRGREARAEYLAKYTPEKNYEQLMAIYESVINRRKN